MWRQQEFKKSSVHYLNQKFLFWKTKEKNSPEDPKHVHISIPLTSTFTIDASCILIAEALDSINSKIFDVGGRKKHLQTTVLLTVKLYS